ncbi:MAG: hypothetical protein SPL25_10015 [Succinivibrionaceae bacterium]|nr:hypothetical protein [Succinivibrionaceae bacterium]
MHDSERRNDIYYVCCMIEFTSRKTKNHRSTVAKKLGISGIQQELSDAAVSHCLSFEEVAEEWTLRYGIPEGDFDTVGNCRYEVPSVTSIGRVYLRLIEAMPDDVPDEEKILTVFTSFISDAISDFNSSVYYSSPDYLRCSFEDGRLLDFD